MWPTYCRLVVVQSAADRSEHPTVGGSVPGTAQFDSIYFDRKLFAATVSLGNKRTWNISDILIEVIVPRSPGDFTPDGTGKSKGERVNGKG